MSSRWRTGRLGLAAALALLPGLLAWALLRPDAAPPARTAGDGARRETLGARPVRTSRTATAPAPATGEAAPLATSSVAPTTSTAVRAWLWRDGVRGPGSILATRLARSGEPVGATVTLMADAEGRLDATPLTDGWWRLAPPDPDDSLRAGHFEEDPTVPATRSWAVVPWGSAGEGPDGYWEAHERRPERPLTVVAWSPLRVHGQVVDDATGAGIPGAWLELERRPVRLSAGPDGRFDHRVPRHACRWFEAVLAGASGYTCAGAQLLEHQRGELLVVRLQRGGLGVEGVVVDDADQPVEARVSVSFRTGPKSRLRSSVVTGPDGRFRFDGIPSGGGLGPRCTRVSVKATAGEAQGERSHDLLPGGARPVRLVVRRPAKLAIQLRSADGASMEDLYARRVDPVSGRSIQTVVQVHPIYLSYYDSDDEGTLVAVEVGALGRLPRRVVARLPVAAPIDVPLSHGDGGTIDGIVLLTGGGPAVEALVWAEWSGPPVPVPELRAGEHVVQELTSGRSCVRTDERGVFSFAGLPVGARFDLEAKGPRSALRARRAGVTPGERIELVLPHTSAAPRLELRVLAAESGERLPPPLRVAQEYLADEGDQVVYEWVDQDDREIAEHGRLGLPVDRRVRLWISAAGRVPAGPFEVHAVVGTRVELGDLRLARAGQVELSIGGWPPLPIERLRARWRDPDGRAREAKGPPEERWTLDGLAPGPTELEVEALYRGEVVRRAKVAVAVRAGETAHATVDLGGD